MRRRMAVLRGVGKSKGRKARLGMSTAIAEVQSVDELSAWCASILERFPEDVRR
jgi:hypothetical protein